MINTISQIQTGKGETIIVSLPQVLHLQRSQLYIDERRQHDAEGNERDAPCSKDAGWAFRCSGCRSRRRNHVSGRDSWQLAGCCRQTADERQVKKRILCEACWLTSTNQVYTQRSYLRHSKEPLQQPSKYSTICHSQSRSQTAPHYYKLPQRHYLPKSFRNIQIFSPRWP